MKEKTVLITGVAKGIGASITCTIAKRTMKQSRQRFNVMEL